MRYRQIRKLNEKRTYGARGNVILVDFQPVHSTSTRLTGPGGYDTSLSNAIEYLNNFNGKALIFYNGMDVGIEDTEEEVQEHYFERGLNTNADLNFMEKGYAFLRGWMDNNIEDWMIIKVFRYMYNNRLNDSRDIEEDQLKAILSDGNRKVNNVYGIDDDLIHTMTTDNIYCAPWFEPNDLKRYTPALMGGGGRDECLREIELMMNAFNFKYKRVRDWIYG